MITFQELIQKLSCYWSSKGCALHQGYDIELGAGTFNPATFFRSLGPEPYAAAYVEPSRRPTDGRYGDNPNRLQHYFQFQVIIKPSPLNIQQLYLDSLECIGFDLKKHDLRFIHDDWKSPTLGAWGLGWEVVIDGMEVSQFTYFQNVAGITLDITSGEISYGLERIAMYLQDVHNVYDLKWNDNLTYGDIYHQNEIEWSTYNFEESSIDLWKQMFESSEEEAINLVKKKLPIPAYDFVMKASHAFNMLEARGIISVTQRTGYINRIRRLACLTGERFLNNRKQLSYPLLKEKSTQKFPPISLKLTSFNPETFDDFILEIGVEELPPAFIPIGMDHLKRDLSIFLKKSWAELRLYFDLWLSETPCCPCRAIGVRKKCRKKTEKRPSS